MATLEMPQFGPVTSAWEAAQFNMAGSTKQAECSGNIQSANNIGFWCDSGVTGGGDGSVMMIGGGGIACRRADHGIGIRGANAASFVMGGGCTGTSGYEHDFVYGSSSSGGCTTQSQSYSLNLWIR